MKTIYSTAVENHTHKIFPEDLNTNGTVFGGLIMSIIDKVALVVAERHAETECATISVDALNFLQPAYLGEILIFKASLNRTWNTSMEVGVRVEAENIRNKEKRHVVSAYFSFVALNQENKPTLVPELIHETPLQRRRFDEAGLRRHYRLTMKDEIKKTRN